MTLFQMRSLRQSIPEHQMAKRRDRIDRRWIEHSIRRGARSSSKTDPQRCSCIDLLWISERSDALNAIEGFICVGRLLSLRRDQWAWNGINKSRAKHRRLIFLNAPSFCVLSQNLNESCVSGDRMALFRVPVDDGNPPEECKPRIRRGLHNMSIHQVGLHPFNNSNLLQ